MKLQYSLVINSTPEIVFSWLSTPEKAVVWQTSVTKTEILHQTKDMIGTTFRETLAENGRSTEMHGIVTEYNKNQRLAMKLNGDYNDVNVEYLIKPVENYTCLTINSTIKFKSFLRIASIILRPVIRKKLLAQLHKEYARLKELCEYGN